MTDDVERLHRATEPRIVAALRESWALATRACARAVYVAHAHAVMSHLDGSTCDGGKTCRIDPDGLAMYELAWEMRDKTYEAFVLAWLRHSVGTGVGPEYLDDEIDDISPAWHSPRMAKKAAGKPKRSGRGFQPGNTVGQHGRAGKPRVVHDVETVATVVALVCART